MSPIATRVADRLAAATQAGDFPTLLTPEAGTDAFALLREATPGPDQPIDERALGDVCMTLFLRGQAMAGAGRPDLIAAGLVGGFLLQRAPRFLPAALSDVLASADDPLREARFAFAAAAAHANAVLSGEDGSGPGAAAGETIPARVTAPGPAELDRALAWSEVAHRAITHRGTAAEAADVTVQRLGLLTARFQRAADLDALTEAGRDGLAIVDRLSPENADHVAYLPPIAATVVMSALLLGSPSVEEAGRVVAMLPSGTATETTTGMLSTLRACHAEPLTWPGEVDARVGLILTAEAGRTGYPGLFAVAASRLRTALAGLPQDHAQHRPLTNALGAVLIGLGERREDTETVQEGLTLLGRSGRLFRLLADQLGGNGMPAELGAATAVLDLLAAVAAGANSDQPRIDEWRENFADAVGRLPEQHPRRSAYTSLLAAATDDPGSLSTAGVLAAAQVDWRGLATELRAAGPANRLAIVLAETFETTADNLGEFGDVVALLDSLRAIKGDGHDRDVHTERIRGMLAAMVDADNDVLSADLRADVRGLLGMLAIDRAAGSPDPAALRQAIQDMARSQRSASPEVANELAGVLGGALLLSMLSEHDRIGGWDQNWDQETRLSIATLLAARQRHREGQDASGPPRLEDAMATLGEMIMAVTTFNAETELSQLDKVEEVGRQLVAMTRQLNPGAGEEVAVVIDTFTTALTGGVHKLEAIQQNRAAESDAETVAKIRRRLADLPPNHPARTGVQAQLAVQLSGQAFDLRDVDPVLGRQLLAEAVALVEQVGEPFTAILHQLTDRAAAALDQRELPAIPGLRPGTSNEEVHERLNQAGNSPEAIRDMLADQDLPVWVRVNAGFTTAFGLLSDLRVGDGLECAEGTVELLATITDRGADTASAEHAIAALIGGLPATVVSAVLAMLHSLAGSRTVTGPLVDRAAVLAERTRGLLLARQLEGRTDLGDLSAAHPELAGRFEALTAQLAADPDVLATLRPDDNPPTSSRAEWSRLVKARASRELDTLIADIRDQDDFHDFLLPSTADQLRALAIDGPVVLLNYPAMPQEASSPVTPFALIVTRDAITSLRIEVPSAQVEQIAGRWTAAVATVNSRGGERPGLADLRRAAADMTEILAWTWHHVVGPVLATAGLPAPADADSDWPRIWWIPDGPFHALPLHAAQCPPSDCQLGGPERTGCGAALDSVVSSYVPGLRILAHARRSATGPAANAALIVAVTDDELPGAEDAARAAAQRLHAGPPLIGAAAGRDIVIDALTEVGVAHFGCHATSDPAEPSGGVLHLPSGDPLTVREICRARPRAARLAFLTACSTARTSRRLANEAIHLSSAFLVAGFSEAVGTLWEIDSRDAERVTADFYRQITGRSPRDGAIALHHSVRALRNERPGDPHVWSAYVHAGAKARERPVPDDRSGAEGDSDRMPCRIGIVTSWDEGDRR